MWRRGRAAGRRPDAAARGPLPPSPAELTLAMVVVPAVRPAGTEGAGVSGTLPGCGVAGAGVEAAGPLPAGALAWAGEQEAGAAAEAAVRARDEVMGIVSHDLGNSLSAVGLHCRVLERLETLDPEEQTFESARIKEIRETLDSLQPREAKIVKLYYGLDGNEPLTLREIGSIFNLSRERIRQIKERAIERLRHQSRARRLQPYH